MQEDKDLQTIEIDLNAAKSGQLDESTLAFYGSWIKTIMGRMFGGESHIPVTVKGTPRQVRDFAKTLGREKKYIKTAARYGLNDPRTYKDKFRLRNMIRKFEGSTGLKWPFK